MANRALALKTLHFLTIGEVMAKALIRIHLFSALKDGVNKICAGHFADNPKIIYLTRGAFKLKILIIKPFVFYCI